MYLFYLKRLFVGMLRLQTFFEIREGLHELSFRLSRCGLILTFCAEVSHKTGQKSLHRPHHLERQVSERMSDSIHPALYLSVHKCPKIDVREDELDAGDAGVEPLAC